MAPIISKDQRYRRLNDEHELFTFVLDVDNQKRIFWIKRNNKNSRLYGLDLGRSITRKFTWTGYHGFPCRNVVYRLSLGKLEQKD